VSGQLIPIWRRAIRRAIAAPGIRLLMPGWPDAGRGVVQSPALSAMLDRATRGTRPARALNAGAGEGLYSALIRRFIGDAPLIEFDFARPPAGWRPGPDVYRFCASLTHIPLATGSADLAVCTEVLEHVRDDECAVSELRRVLSPTGALVLSVPTPPAVFDPAHVREGYTLDQLGGLFERHGLEILEARYCMHAGFQFLLRRWRPRRVPLGCILLAAWFDRVFRPGAPMDLIVLSRPTSGVGR
jgi:SAM-dependent methyltransferase